MAMLRGGYVTNAALREWGADRTNAGQVLRELVGSGVAIRQGGRRYARYVLDPSIPRTVTLREPTSQAMSRPTVEGEMRARGAATAAQLQERTGLSRVSVLAKLKALIASGDVETEGAPRSPKRSYRWIGDAGHGEDST